MELQLTGQTGTASGATMSGAMNLPSEGVERRLIHSTIQPSGESLEVGGCRNTLSVLSVTDQGRRLIISFRLPMEGKSLTLRMLKRSVSVATTARPVGSVQAGGGQDL